MALHPSGPLLVGYMGICGNAGRVMRRLGLSEMINGICIADRAGKRCYGMDDRKKVVSHLQIINTWASFAIENDLNLFDKKHIASIADWAKEAIDILNDEPVKPHVVVHEKTPGGRPSKRRKAFCGACGAKINVNSNYCDICGKAVKWNG